MRRKAKWAVGGLLLVIACAFYPPHANAGTVLSVSMDDKLMQMDVEDYLVGVVAAEMPASYEMEALKAQAVAARTRVSDGRCLSNPGADVCTNSACCQGYMDEQERQEKWGVDAIEYGARIAEAVEATRGMIMLYDGKPIEVLYHAVSGGMTENVEEVFANALPYLRSVESPGEENASSFETVQVFAKHAIVEAFPDAAQDGKLQLEILERTESGRVAFIRVGRLTMTGRLFRSALNLKSTNFELSERGDEIVITQRGYGHGVGMSQAGANAMALAGSDFETILAHYYTGVTLGQMTEQQP